MQTDTRARKPAGVVRKSARQQVLAHAYPLWFYAPAAVLFVVLFAVPTFASFYFSLTRWTLFDVEFIGLDNFVAFFHDPMLKKSFVNTFIFGIVTTALKMIFGLALALLLVNPIFGRGYLRSVIFFPVLVSTIGVGIIFRVIMNPFDGLINLSLAAVGIDGPRWLTDPALVLLSIAFVEVWKGVGVAALIYMAGLVAIPRSYVEAARVDGASPLRSFWHITLPMLNPATSTVVLLALIGGLRSFDLVWAMTQGGPGFTSDVLASVIYKQYQAGFYGLSTAGNVVLFVVVSVAIIPLVRFFRKREIEL